MSKHGYYAEWIRDLPEADIAFPGVKGWISQARDHQVVFMDIDATGDVPPHHHGAQWGVVLEGRMELTIGGETKVYGPGDSYSIGEGVVHAARFLSPVKVIDVFADADRYSPKA
jgi:quercetin dioxygenase-like cupin family protein